MFRLMEQQYIYWNCASGLFNSVKLPAYPNHQRHFVEYQHNCTYVLRNIFRHLGKCRYIESLATGPALLLTVI